MPDPEIVPGISDVVSHLSKAEFMRCFTMIYGFIFKFMNIQFTLFDGFSFTFWQILLGVITIELVKFCCETLIGTDPFGFWWDEYGQWPKRWYD